MHTYTALHCRTDTAARNAAHCCAHCRTTLLRALSQYAVLSHHAVHTAAECRTAAHCRSHCRRLPHTAAYTATYCRAHCCTLCRTAAHCRTHCRVYCCTLPHCPTLPRCCTLLLCRISGHTTKHLNPIVYIVWLQLDSTPLRSSRYPPI
jgi:hypothetical protein